MSTMKIKRGDTVKVIAGKDKDKEGKVVAVEAHKAFCSKPEWRNYPDGSSH